MSVHLLLIWNSGMENMYGKFSRRDNDRISVEQIAASHIPNQVTFYRSFCPYSGEKQYFVSSLDLEGIYRVIKLIM